ncbi:surface antigen (D15) [Magnetococcus marinus MC-1]|uniref:Surface antigen (D15) n=1 Tax=Magnetococcus marinus (strain ATCC BAA-1437 / JCM 17883 / MC-1) TaxID=156889 RepID=A0LAJ0_MAGMM|nr:BamA/TamA family outer membrane protein [Magnetococcus marinus]ABK44983.1 surface antigen (D15) [Magnetococcus marinus MC-1]
MRLFSGMLLLLLLGLPLSVQAEGEAVYKVVFTGIAEEGPLQRLLQQVSDTVARQDQPPPSPFLLAQRARKDLLPLEEAMRSRGYFDAQVALLPIAEAAPPYGVRFKVSPGPLYQLGVLKIMAEPATPDFIPPSLEKLGLSPGAAALSRTILDAEAALLEQTREQGYPFARALSREAWVQPQSHSLDVTFQIETGPLVTLGSPQREGGETVDAAFLQRRVPWPSGTRYHPQRIAELRQAFVSTGLFRQVRITLPREANPQGLWSPLITLGEKAHRTVRAGGGWHSDRGPQLHAEWEHRNYFGAGEGLNLSTKLSSDQQLLKAELSKPDFGERRRTMRLASSLERAQEEAYDRLGVNLEGHLLWPWRQPYDLSFGADLGMASLKDLSSNKKESYATLSLPVGISADATDDPLDAVRGYRTTLELTPVIKLYGFTSNYLKFTGNASGYWQLQEQPRLVLASRLQLGMAMGAPYEDIPVDKRFYAGGGGTIRGYGHQLAGPLDSKLLPIGGRSMLVLNSEVRYRMMDKLGLVGFVDAGRAYASAVPDGSADPLVGVGLGLRYASPMGPFRFDLGLPTKQRQGVDDPFQIYLSIGQAF